MPKTASAKRAADAPAERSTGNQAKVSTYVSSFTLQLGLVTTTGKLVNVRKSEGKAGKFVTACPECQTAQMNMRFACPSPTHRLQLKNGDDTYATFEPSEVLRAKEIADGHFAIVTAEEVAAARASELTVNVMELNVHPADEVKNMTWSDDSAYAILPNLANDRAYSLIADKVAEGEYAMVGVVNVRNHEGFYKLDVWQGVIILQRALFPSACNKFEVELAPADERYSSQLESLLEAVCTPFDPNSYIDGTKERVAALEAALAAGKTPVPAPVKAAPAQSGDSLLAALEASLAATKKKARK